ncbi:assimilatory sulfite reductase (NADPH) flavoprotein subunit [Rhodanobacter hydrolyticus]|uniref:Assimilatory sulfite reductase (NADPH) flavoprotein subunit n=1 Tax=Rhodanobacter hydrolyticus TaxID=2250595 RepID=A0ABW8J2R3_9GAMM
MGAAAIACTNGRLDVQKESHVSAATRPILPAPALAAERLALLNRLTEGLPPADLYWVSAWTAALAAQATRVALPAAAPPAANAAADERLTVLYGSQTGNSRRVAERLAERAAAAGLNVRLLRTGAYPVRELAQERHLVLVISSQGDGDPPDDAIGFVEFLAGKRAPKLPQLRFAVLGLGDSSYPQFCAVSRRLDARFAELGARRFAELGEADVDFEAPSASWSDGVLEKAREVLDAPATLGATGARPSLHAVSSVLQGREHPFAAEVLDNQRIVSRDSSREVRHLELSLQGSGLRYEPGDALGVWPRNPPALVGEYLRLLGLDGEQEVAHDGRRLPLARWLSQERELTKLSRPLLAAHAADGGDTELAHVLEPAQREALGRLLDTHQPIDVLRRYPVQWNAEQLVAALRPLTPRLYSIASSPKAVGEDEVHLTIAVVNYHAYGSEHAGAASSFLATAADDARVPVFVEPNERFRLPADGSRDIIMIGPGTGVAPFRAFVQERLAVGAAGRNWLFFGNRHFARDFLYQVEWQQALKDGGLDRLDLAFSRDGAAKTYVQHKLREHGRELYARLRDGAHLYVCGDATHMAKDVNEALVEVAVAHGGLSSEDARGWLTELLQEGRYARDVY